MIYLTRAYLFSASHRLHSDRLSEEENWRVYGKCNNPHGHGHNYRLEVTLAGDIDPATGMLCDLGELDRFVEEKILERFDHANLNEDKQVFAEAVPTSENLCRAIFQLLKEGYKQAKVHKVWLGETSSNSFEYSEVSGTQGRRQE